MLAGPPVLDVAGRLLTVPSPPAPPQPRLRILEQELVDLESGTLYVAIVGNEDRSRRAIGVHPRGDFLDARGEPLARASPRRQVALPANIAPGGLAVVADVLDELDIAERVRRMDVRMRARRARPGPAEPPLTTDRPQLDTRDCVASARVRGPRSRLEGEVVLLLRDRARRIQGVDFGWAGPIGVQPTRQALARVAPGICRGARSVDVFPLLGAREPAAEARRSER